MQRWTFLSGVFLIPLVCGSCVIHGTADHWNGLVNADGHPAYLNTTTKLGFKLLVVIPFLGKTDLDGLVKDATADIAEQRGDYIRVVQSTSENYWYGLPPLTWIVTPVITTLTVEYRPSAQALLKDNK